jgi:hypothetical protein
MRIVFAEEGTTKFSLQVFVGKSERFYVERER